MAGVEQVAADQALQLGVIGMGQPVDDRPGGHRLAVLGQWSTNRPPRKASTSSANPESFHAWSSAGV